MLCILWDCRGSIYYELLPTNKTINSEKYCEPLNILKSTIEERRPGLANRHGVVFYQYNAVNTLQKLKGFGWDILNHPSYSPDMTPSNHLDDFFASKPEGFYRTGIEKLSEWWQTVLENNGHYVIDRKYICLLKNWFFNFLWKTARIYWTT